MKYCLHTVILCTVVLYFAIASLNFQAKYKIQLEIIWLEIKKFTTEHSKLKRTIKNRHLRQHHKLPEREGGGWGGQLKREKHFHRCRVSFCANIHKTSEFRFLMKPSLMLNLDFKKSI